MTAAERNERIFQASIGCSSAAVEFLRSVNKPLNVTYIAQTAWEIAKKLEEFMEVNSKKETEAEAKAAPAAPAAVASTPTPAAKLTEADLVPMK
jgi:hypothetical protein